MELSSKVGSNANSRYGEFSHTMPKITNVILILLVVVEALVCASANLSDKGLHYNDPKSRSWKIGLMHPLDASLPFVRPNLSFSQRVQLMVKSSIERLNLLTNKTSLEKITFGREHLQHTLFPGLYSYRVPLSIGHDDILDMTPRNFFLLLDIALDLTWVKCRPWDTPWHSDDDVFYPQLSPSYTNHTCQEERDAETCDTFRQTQSQICQTPTCEYSFQYRKWIVTGTLGYDIFTFSNQGNPIEVRVLFGCEHNEASDFQGSVGVYGLGLGGRSFLTQMDINTFSYCLGELNSATNTAGSLTFGSHEGSKKTLHTTLWAHSSRVHQYFVRLEAILVGKQEIFIPEGAMSMTRVGGNGGFAIDTLAPFTFFESRIYVPFRNAIIAELKNASKTVASPVGHDNHYLDVCYNIEDIHDPYNKVPEVTLVFEGKKYKEGTQIVLPPSNTFIVSDHTACLAFMHSPNDQQMNPGLNLLGNFQQKDIEIVIDTKEKTVGFEHRDCISR